MKHIFLFTFLLLFLKFNAQNVCNQSGNLVIYSNYDGGILVINVDQNIPNLVIGICTYEPVQVTISGPFASNVSQVIYAGFNSSQNNNNCNLGNFPTSISGVSANLTTILTTPQVGYTPVHNNGAGPWGGIMVGAAGLCDTTINAGGGNTPDEIVYFFENYSNSNLMFHYSQYACWQNQTMNISQGGNCCIDPSDDSSGCGLSASITVQPNSVCQPCNYNGPTILINEINIYPSFGDGSILGPSPTAPGMGEWIELFNPNWCDSVDISGYILGSFNSTASANPATSNGMAFVLPQGTIVPPLGFVLVRGQNATIPPNTAIDVIVNNNNNQACISGGINNSRIWFQNSGSWFAFYNAQGIPQDAIKWGTPNNNDLNQSPCIPFNNSLPLGTTSLASFNQISALGLSSTLGTSSQGMTYRRIPDGGAWSTTLAMENSSYGSCNDPANCAIFSGVAQCNGTGTVNISAGQAPFSFQWNDPLSQTTQTASNLCEGTYSVVVTDANNCQETYTVEVITNPFNLSTTIQHPTCLQSDGSISVNPFNSSYSYTWNPPVSTTNTASNLPQGSYTITIDQGFCSFDTTIVLQNPVPFQTNLQVTHTICGINNGNIVIDVIPNNSGYSYNWTPNISSTNIASNLTPGTYSVSISDNTCSFDTTLIILSSQPITSTADVYNSTCQESNGAISLNIFPVSNYTFSWPSNVNSVLDSAGNLSAGSYFISFTDGICTGDTTILISTTSPPTDISYQVLASRCDENTGNIAITSTVGGVFPYSYSINNGSFSSSITFDSLGSGEYLVAVLDSNNCTYQENIFVPIFSGPTSIQIAYDNPSCGLSNGSLTFLGAVAGTEPYIYSINGEPISAQNGIFNLAAGGYNLSVVDANGCFYNQLQELIMTAGEPSVIIPNVLTGNEDQINDVWKIDFTCVDFFECSVFNRWGIEIYFFNDINGGWNGKTISGTDAVNGVYFYKLIAHYFDGESEEFHGHITLIR